MMKLRISRPTGCLNVIIAANGDIMKDPPAFYNYQYHYLYNLMYQGVNNTISMINPYYTSLLKIKLKGWYLKERLGEM